MADADFNNDGMVSKDEILTITRKMRNIEAKRQAEAEVGPCSSFLWSLIIC
jgi:hypothetical protein